MTRARRTRVVGIALAVVVVAVVLMQLRGGAADPPADALADPGVFRSPPFRVRLSGPLWRARSLRDQDGAADFAIVAGDLPLDIQVSASGRARIAAVDLRVDGRPQRGSPARCGESACPAEMTVTLVPKLRGLPAGDHSVQVYARAVGASAPARPATFDVRVTRSVPQVVEGLPATKDPPPAPRDGDPALARAALAVLAAERSRPGLAAALANSQVSVIQAGPLNARERRLGATLWVALAAPLRDVRTTVPGYVPTTAATGPAYRPQAVSMHVALLRDALIDVDLTTRRVIAFEPGPRSRTITWKPSRAPAPAGAGDED
jgi:hypothetical protein